MLLIAQFIYNSKKSKLIRVSPFYINYKFELKLYKQLRKDKSVLKNAIIFKESLTALYKQLIRDIKLKNKRIV